MKSSIFLIFQKVKTTVTCLSNWGEKQGFSLEIWCSLVFLSTTVYYAYAGEDFKPEIECSSELEAKSEKTIFKKETSVI